MAIGKRIPGHIPTIFVTAASLPEAWEKALLNVWENGVQARTEYDRKDARGNYIDPPSRDSTVVVEVSDPFREPRIHKNIPTGPEELEVYRQEVLCGIHDHWVDPSDPLKWTYTYHGRLFRYTPTEDLRNPAARTLAAVNQMEVLLEKLTKVPFTRRAQATTWMPNADPQTDDPPCLQRLWCRLIAAEDGQYLLNMNTHWRSRDGYKAWFMNAFAMTELQRFLADEISERTGRPVSVGRYVDISDSFHLNGSYFGEIEPEIAKMKADADFRKRSWRSDDPVISAIFEETRQKLKADPDYMRGTVKR